MARAMKHSRQTNEGEGNRTADRRYREGVERHLTSGRSKKAARDAQRALDGAQGEALRQAEREGKERADGLAGDDDAEEHLERGKE